VALAKNEWGKLEMDGIGEGRKKGREVGRILENNFLKFNF